MQSKESARRGRRVVALAAAAVLALSPAFAGAQPAPDSERETNEHGVPAPMVLPTEFNDEYLNTPRDLTGCPFKTTPPPAINSSEEPRPGTGAPSAPAVPDRVVGGDQLEGCEVVAADGFDVPETVTASGWIVVDADSGDVLAAQDPHGRYRPASVIKTLLALAVTDELELDEVVTVTEEDLDGAEGSLVGIGPGGEYTVEQLLHGLLLNSGNDAAFVLAGQLGGRQEALRKMNDLATTLGATDTSVTSVSGLDRPGFMSSAYDIALFFRAAIDDEDLTRIFQTKLVGFPGFPAGEGAEAPDPHDPAGAPAAVTFRDDGTMVAPGFALSNDNMLIHTFEGTIAGKTGFTNAARQTFAAAAERDGRRLVVALLDGTRIPLAPWQQAEELLEAGFATPEGESVGELVSGPIGEDASSLAAPVSGLIPNSPPAGTDSVGDYVSHYWPWAVGSAAFLGIVILLLKMARRRG